MELSLGEAKFWTAGLELWRDEPGDPHPTPSAVEMAYPRLKLKGTLEMDPPAGPVAPSPLAARKHLPLLAPN